MACAGDALPYWYSREDVWKIEANIRRDNISITTVILAACIASTAKIPPPYPWPPTNEPEIKQGYEQLFQGLQLVPRRVAARYTRGINIVHHDGHRLPLNVVAVLLMILKHRLSPRLHIQFKRSKEKCKYYLKKSRRFRLYCILYKFMLPYELFKELYKVQLKEFEN